MGDRAPEKAAFGSPCNGCGYCCAAERCAIAVQAMGPSPGPCPAMEFEDSRFWCGMIRHPSRYVAPEEDTEVDRVLGNIVAIALGIDKGCDADDWEAVDG